MGGTITPNHGTIRPSPDTGSYFSGTRRLFVGIIESPRTGHNFLASTSRDLRFLPLERARRGLSNDPQVCVDIHSPSRVMISLKRMVRWPFGTMEIKHGTMGGTIGTIVPQ